jgi:serine/threonine protein phosphatase PrpC
VSVLIAIVSVLIQGEKKGAMLMDEFLSFNPLFSRPSRQSDDASEPSAARTTDSRQIGERFSTDFSRHELDGSRLALDGSRHGLDGSHHLPLPKTPPRSGSYSLVRKASASAQALVPSIFASHATRLKGEDGLRIERIVIGGDIVICAIVVDGHGGYQTAAYVVEHLIEFLLIEFLFDESQGDASGSALSEALKRTFRRLHEQVCADLHHTAGAAVTVCLINETRGELTTAHVGDAAAMLVLSPTAGRRAADQRAMIPLTDEHRLDDSEDERARVKEQGGQLGRASSHNQAAGPIRAYPGGVACARAIGDRDCGPWLSPVPNIQTMPLLEAHSLVVIASDGVWDALPPQKVVTEALRANNVFEAAHNVMAKALKARGLRDDITCVCIICSRKDSQKSSPEHSSDENTDESRQRVHPHSSAEDKDEHSSTEDKDEGTSSMPSLSRQASSSVPSSPTTKRKPLLSMLIPSALRRSPASSPDPSTKGGMMFANSDALLAQQMHLMLAGHSLTCLDPGGNHRSMDGSHHSVASSTDDEGLHPDSQDSPRLFAPLNRQAAMQLRPGPGIDIEAARRSRARSGELAYPP